MNTLACSSDRVVVEPPPEWAVLADPVVRIGHRGDPSGIAFQHLLFVAVMADRRIVVVERADPAVHVFAGEGRRLERFGRSGRGPGELSRPAGAWMHGPDTLRVLDIRYPRVVSFGLDGAYLGVVELDPSVGPADRVVGAFGDGRFVLSETRYGEPTDGVFRDVVSYHRFAADGTYEGVLATAQGRERYLVETPRGPRPRGHPGSPEPSAIIHGDRLLHADGGDSILVWTAEGTPTRGWRVPLPEGPTPDAGRTGRSGRGSGTEGTPAGLPALDRTPVASGLVIDDEGRLWVRAFGRTSTQAGEVEASPTDLWWVLDPEGSPLATVALPTGFELRSVVGPRLLGVQRDEFGVESIVVHALAEP